MGEIKSTLELVLERTKNLKFDDKEREAILAEERNRKVRGIVQRYIDGIEPIKQFLKRIEELSRKEPDIDWKRLVWLNLLRSINMYNNNREIILALRELNFPYVQEVLSAVELGLKEKKILKKELNNKIIDRLRNMKISGSAIIPNVEAEEEYNEKLKAIQDKIIQKLILLIEDN